MPPALVPIAVPPCSQPVEQPLDLSKKVAFAISAAKENDTSNRRSPPCEQKDDNAVPSVDNDDLEDSPLVIDEETTGDPVEAKPTPPSGETNTKVR